MRSNCTKNILAGNSNVVKVVQHICTVFVGVASMLVCSAQTDIQEVNWTMKKDSFVLQATLSSPASPGQQTAILFISGSGPTDRDGNNPFMKNNSIKGLSDSLVLEGYTTLRFDKRGIAESASKHLDESVLTFDDFVSDASHWLSKLKDSFPDYEYVIAGHSQGALIAVLVAQENKVDGLISMSGTGRPFDEIIREQLGKQIPTLVAESDSIMRLIKAGEPVEQMNPMLMSIFRPSVQPFIRSYMQYDPAKEIAALDIRVLIVQGANDLQVTTEDAQALHRAYPDASLKIIPRMNHVLKDIDGGAIKNQESYNNPELPVSRDLLHAVKNFLKNL